MSGVLGVLVRDAIVDTDPLVPVVVSSHAVVEHGPSLLNQVGKGTTGSFVLGVFLDVIHLQNDPLAHYGAPDGRIATVQHVPLVFFDCLVDAVLKDLLRSCVLKA